MLHFVWTVPVFQELLFLLGERGFLVLLVPVLLFHRNLKIILFLLDKRSLGMGNTLLMYQSLDSSIVFIITVFSFRERCLWFCILTLFSIFWYILIYYIFLPFQDHYWNGCLRFSKTLLCSILLEICCCYGILCSFGLIILLFY